MSNLERQEKGKLVQIATDFEFENDFGQEPMILGHITQDQGVIAVCSLVGAFIGTAISPPLGIIALAVGLNDFLSAGRRAKPVTTEERDSTRDNSPLIDVESSAVETEQVEQESVLAPRPQWQPVQSNTTECSFPEKPQSSRSPSVQKQQPSAYSMILDSPDVSRVIFGAQRTGKSYLAAVASQQLYSQRNFTIYHINLDSVQKGKAVEEDATYWSHALCSIRADLGALNAYDANMVIDDAIATVEQFWRDTSAILIVDEWATQTSIHNVHSKALQPLNSMLASRISTLTSTGVKRERAIWAIAPECVMGDLTQEGKSFKKLQLCYATIAPKKFVKWGGNDIGFDDKLFTDVSRNFTNLTYPDSRFNDIRIAFINNRWLSIGDLPPLDPTLCPQAQVVPATATADTLQSSAVTEYSDTDKDEAVEIMMSALTNSKATTLWGFVRDELGIEESEDIKAIALKIAQMLVDDELTSLKSKFRIQSVWDVRYSYPDYAKKVAQTHRYTGNKCCCCLQAESKEAHHTQYLGFDDEAGKNLLPVCLNCHKSLCHSKENWVQGSPWEACNTPEWKAKLQAGFEMLVAQQTK